MADHVDERRIAVATATRGHIERGELFEAAARLRDFGDWPADRLRMGLLIVRAAVRMGTPQSFQLVGQVLRDHVMTVLPELPREVWTVLADLSYPPSGPRAAALAVDVAWMMEKLLPLIRQLPPLDLDGTFEAAMVQAWDAAVASAPTPQERGKAMLQRATHEGLSSQFGDRAATLLALHDDASESAGPGRDVVEAAMFEAAKEAVFLNDFKLARSLLATSLLGSSSVADSARGYLASHLAHDIGLPVFEHGVGLLKVLDGAPFEAAQAVVSDAVTSAVQQEVHRATQLTPGVGAPRRFANLAALVREANQGEVSPRLVRHLAKATTVAVAAAPKQVVNSRHRLSARLDAHLALRQVKALGLESGSPGAAESLAR